MGRLEELLELAKQHNTETPLPDNFGDELETQTLMSWEMRDKKIEQLERENAEQRDKIRNYAVETLDMIRNKPNTDAPPAGSNDKTDAQKRAERKARIDKALGL